MTNREHDSDGLGGNPYRTMLEETLADRPAGGWTFAGGDDEPGEELAGPWISVWRAGRAAGPSQGWKLHVSAGIGTAETVLRRCLPVLLDAPCSFKFARSPAVLAQLNVGRAGPSQIGKFITVYPSANDEAVQLAARLDSATRDLAGPAIPSDRPLRPASVVHYRYGDFAGRLLQSPSGEIVTAIEDPAGRLVADPRSETYAPPAWVTDPFLAAGASVPVPSRPRLLGSRYLPLAAVYRSPATEVDLAVDLRADRRCMLKRARRGAHMALDGRDARDRLAHEAGLLADLASAAGVPALYELLPDGEDLVLAMEDVEGVTLAERVRRLRHQGRFLRSDQVLGWGVSLASALERLHAAGILHRDVKASNVVVGPGDEVRLIDLNTAERMDGAALPKPMLAGGTAGYMSPQQAAGCPPTASDDVYGCGATLYFAATGADPASVPGGPAARPIALLNARLPAAITDVIERALDADASRRHASAADLQNALRLAGAHVRAAAPAKPDRPASARRAAALASELRASLAHDARAMPGTACVAWPTKHASRRHMCTRHLGLGTAGTIIALAHMGAAHGRDDASLLRSAAEWLATGPIHPGPPLPGLHVGEAGVGAALLRAGQVLQEPDLVEAAMNAGRLVASMPLVSPDVFHGAAGRLLFHLLLYDESGDDAALGDAVAAAEWLLASAVVEQDGSRCRWVLPDGYGDLSGATFLGYAHGSAGIADALLALYETTHDSRLLSTARATQRWLEDRAVPVLDDESGLNWPSRFGDEHLPGPFWCHGAAGVGQFFLASSRHDSTGRAHDVASRAARAVALGGRWTGPTQCHGLAGGIEFLLDMYQATGTGWYCDQAIGLLPLLESFAVRRDAHLRWSSDGPDLVTPDFGVGYSGVACALLRLSDPERLPRALSREGFRLGGPDT